MSKIFTEQRIQESMFNQIKSEVYERNEYRKLLEECLFSLNQLKNMHSEKNINMAAHELVTKIEILL